MSGSIEDTPDGGLLIGASVRNSALAADARVRTRYPMLARALLSGASAQIRNMATVGGNLLQRTRCSYFYDVPGANCNKRSPGSGCDALGGFTRYHAIFGGSDHCVATHPSDMCVPLIALDAVVHVEGRNDARSFPLADLHRLPGETPHIGVPELGIVRTLFRRERKPTRDARPSRTTGTRKCEVAWRAPLSGPHSDRSEEVSGRCR